MKNKANPKPNLFVVGYPKSGTTSFYEYIKEHKDVFTPNEKEPTYFSKDILKEIHLEFRLKPYLKNLKNSKRFITYSKLENYESLYKDSKKERYLLDSSTSYILSKVAIKEIHKYNKNSKVIIFLREPTSFIQSLYNHFFSSGQEDITSLKRAYLTGIKREIFPKYLDYKSKLNYKSYLEYENNISKVLTYFKSKDILIIFSEEFKKNPQKEMEKACKFLDIKSIKFNVEKKHNVKRVIKNKKLYQFIIKNNFIINSKSYLPKPIFELCKKILVSNNTKLYTLNKEDEQFLIELKKELKSKIKSLQTFLLENKLIDKNTNIVKLWGYDDINHKEKSK